MLRCLGAILLAGGAAAVGFSAAGQLTKRVQHLRALLVALELMERELAFRLTPMPALFAQLVARVAPPVNALFTQCLEGIQRIGELPLAQNWREAVEHAPLCLKPQERATLAALGDILGHYDGAGQLESIAHARSSLERDLKNAEEEQARQGRMYRVLGLTAGAFFVVLLI